MNRTEKNEVVNQIAELLNSSSAIYLTDFSGINVEDISKLRRELRKEGVKYKVFKNTLFNRALSQIGKYDKLSNYLTGMTGFIFTTDNPIAPAKIIKKYFDDKSKFPLKACYIDSSFYDGNKLDELSKLPTKNEIIAGILGSLDSPVSGVVGAINAVIRDLVSVVDEISKKQAA
jgi:large subunit ribosomal protein L10